MFSELEQLGIKKLDDVSIFEKETEVKEEKKQVSDLQKEKRVLYDRSCTCPVCLKEFKTKAVKTGKARLMSVETDLRPIYDLLDTTKYDVIVCPKCGYSALNKYFNIITDVQKKWIKQKISNQFKGIENEKEIYDYEDAIKRYKLTLLNTVVKKGKLSEKAYICLKLTWMLRCKRMELEEYDDDIYNDLLKQEKNFTQHAYEGFSKAFVKEGFPMCGMDEMTVTYLIGELARRVGNNEESLRWLSKVIVSRIANERLKNKAREVKEIIKGNE